MITNFAEKQAELKKQELEEEIEEYEQLIEALQTPCSLFIELHDCGVSVTDIFDLEDAAENYIKQYLVGYYRQLIDEHRKEIVNVNTFPKG